MDVCHLSVITRNQEVSFLTPAVLRTKSGDKSWWPRRSEHPRGLVDFADSPSRLTAY